MINVGRWNKLIEVHDLCGRTPTRGSKMDEVMKKRNNKLLSWSP